MPADDEQILLANYVADRSDLAFRGLVDRHIDMVFGCAIRRTGDAGLAEEISQNVFTILARKAKRLKADTSLAGWLHKTTLYESSKALRGETRRKQKMKALAEHTRTQNGHDTRAQQILPLVDEAIDELGEDDRRIVLLHYIEGRTFREISQAVGKSEAASQKQALRAITKLVKILKRRGVGAMASTLGALLAVESAKAAPAGIASTISAGAIASAPTLATSTLITNAIQTMTYAKTKIAILIAGAAAVPIGVQMNSISDLKDDLISYQAREEEFVGRGERLMELEEKIEKLSARTASREPGGKKHFRSDYEISEILKESIKSLHMEMALLPSPPQIDVGQVEEFIEEQNRSAESYVAAALHLSDPSFLRRALEEHPGDLAIRSMLLVMDYGSATPEELAEYRRMQPNSPLSDYLEATKLMRDGEGPEGLKLLAEMGTGDFDLSYLALATSGEKKLYESKGGIDSRTATFSMGSRAKVNLARQLARQMGPLFGQLRSNAESDPRLAVDAVASVIGFTLKLTEGPVDLVQASRALTLEGSMLTEMPDAPEIIETRFQNSREEMIAQNRAEAQHLNLLIQLESQIYKVGRDEQVNQYRTLIDSVGQLAALRQLSLDPDYFSFLTTVRE